jgi:hypothetical protein
VADPQFREEDVNVNILDVHILEGSQKRMPLEVISAFL